MLNPKLLQQIGMLDNFASESLEDKILAYERANYILKERLGIHSDIQTRSEGDNKEAKVNMVLTKLEEGLISKGKSRGRIMSVELIVSKDIEVSTSHVWHNGRKNLDGRKRSQADTILETQ